MIEKNEYFADLALGYIQNTLSTEEKHLAQELVLDSPEFLEALKVEINLKNRMTSLKRPLPAPLEERVYASVFSTSKLEGPLYKKVMQTVVEATLPNMVRPIYQLFQRSVLANE